MNILGIKCSGHDTGASLVTDKNGKLEIAAISEARLNRRKHSFCYPLLSIRYVMESFGIKSLDEIDLICIDKHGENWPDANSQFGFLSAVKNEKHRYDKDNRFNYLVEQSINFPKEKIKYVNHIDAHAASCFYVSGFEQAAVLTIEGGIGVYEGYKTELKILERSGYRSDEYQNGQITHNSSRSYWPKQYQNISNLYDLITSKLGLDEFASGKTMALAAFRDKFPVKDYLQIPKDRHSNSFFMDYTEVISKLTREIPQFKATSRENRDNELLAEYWVNISREVQDVLEEDIMHLCKLTAKKIKSRNLCLAGGVALSCVTNRKILDLGLFDNIFVQPAASDEGIPLGCALWGYYNFKNGKKLAPKMETAYLGTPNNPIDVEPLLKKWNLNYKKVQPSDVAKIIANGGIIGRITGGSEYGPRALGNRSIHADPRIANMLEVVNTQIKHRERYRPFAPSCIEEKQEQYFDLPCSSPFMLMACQVKDNEKKNIPAVIHVDGTSRVQTVRADQNQRYYELIKEFGNESGVYVLLNTSFNDDGEPIVETYEDSLLSFVRTGLHYLYIEDFLVERPLAEECQRIKSELAKLIKLKVENNYNECIAKFCDVNKFKNIESEVLNNSSKANIFSVVSFFTKAKQISISEYSTNSFVSKVKKCINKIAIVSRHEKGFFIRSTAFVLISLIAVVLNKKLFQPSLAQNKKV